MALTSEGENRRSERGKPGSFDPQSGEVHGSGAGAGGGNPAEDYDSDAAAGSGAVPQGGPQPGEAPREHRVDPDEGV